MSFFVGSTGSMSTGLFCGVYREDLSWYKQANRQSDSHNLWWDSWAIPTKRPVIWPTNTMMMSGDRSEGYCLSGLDAADSGAWGVQVENTFGFGRVKYIIGQAKDSGGSGVSGATLKAFLTSDDSFVSTIGSDSSGNYASPTPYTGSQHYVVATGTGVAGVTVNTLTPTEADGT